MGMKKYQYFPKPNLGEAVMHVCAVIVSPMVFYTVYVLYERLSVVPDWKVPIGWVAVVTFFLLGCLLGGFGLLLICQDLKKLWLYWKDRAGWV
jgi:hypothetical protein